MIRRTISTLAALIVGVLLAGCAVPGSSGETHDVFAIAPWPESEALEYRVINTAGDEIGRGTLSTERSGDEFVLRQEYREIAPPEGMTATSDAMIVRVDAVTFKPSSGDRTIIRRTDDRTMDEERWDWRYETEDGRPLLVSIHTNRSGDERERTLRVRDHFYDNESSLWLWRSIDLEEEHEDRYVSANAIDGSQQTVHLRVPQTEQVVVPAGEFEAYRLLFRTGRAVRTAWIESAEPHRVLRWDNGDVILELLP